MSVDTFHRVIGRALTDRRFRENLLRQPREAILEYPLSREERSLIVSLRAGSLEEFAQKLSEGLEAPANGDKPNGKNGRNGRT